MPSRPSSPDRLARLRPASAPSTAIDSRGSKTLVAVVARAGRGGCSSSPARSSSLASSIISGPARRAVVAKRDAVPLLAAEQLVDRHAQRLALDVVQRDVDRRDRGRQHAPALEVLAAVHLLPEPADVHRVVAEQELAVVLDARPATASSRPERPDSPQPWMPSSVSTLTSSWFRMPTQTGYDLMAVIFMPLDPSWAARRPPGHSSNQIGCRSSAKTRLRLKHRFGGDPIALGRWRASREVRRVVSPWSRPSRDFRRRRGGL